MRPSCARSPPPRAAPSPNPTSEETTMAHDTETAPARPVYQHGAFPDARGRFGAFGGRFVPESLMAALDELEAAYTAARGDPAFAAELAEQERTFTGRPTPLYAAERLSRRVGARVFLKRE